MRRSVAFALAATTIGATALVPALATSATAATTAAPTGSAYAQAVLKDDPTAFLQGLDDVTGNTANGTVVGGSTATKLPNGDPALAFNGKGQYAQFSDSKAFEVDNTGVLTAEYWLRPDALEFSDVEGSGYVYTLGKGTGNQHEWYARMYSKTNQENRPNRISGYVFNPAGGLGSGSYFEDPVKTGEWIHVALVINARAKSSAYPMGYVKIYKNGVLRDTDSLQNYDITPRSGTAPLRVGTGYLNSFFQGALGDISFYDRELTQAQIADHQKAMSAAAPSGSNGSTGPTGSTTTPSGATTTKPATPAEPAGPVAPVRPTTPVAPTMPTQAWTHEIDGTDVRRRTDQLIRYTPDRGPSTGTNPYGAEVTVVDGRITAVTNGAGNADVPEGGYVLSGHGASRTWLRDYARIGSTVEIAGSTVTITSPQSK
ncbi:LamG-like jellyroll fold domain-containing protein [Marmoricola sp. RAF53]|uniref:LamG-like jellyroll fold domain-containing protein n=1 Tax=Marmoricola sp. RAF53 TaxID=3233059 RepID=UPI003F986F5A